MLKKILPTLKGFRDFLPPQALKRQWLTKKIQTVFELWGYDPLETPTLERLSLFTGQIGEDEKLFYQFTDKGGRELALRYDQTVPACRVVSQNRELALPFRRYQIQTAFRAEKPQAGRYREFLQADADIFGISSPYADAEVIALSLDLYRRLGFKQYKLLVNDRQLLLEKLPLKAISSLDKIRKIGADAVLREMNSKGVDLATGRQYLTFVKNLKPNDTIKVIFNYLKQLGFPAESFVFEPTLCRAFSYSTGPIWEIEIPGFTAGSVLGGERYDQLILKLSGTKIPGTGFAVGFDRTLEAAQQLGLVPEIKTTTQVLLTIFEPDFLPPILKLGSKLRQTGIKTEIYPDPQVKLEKQLKYANQKGIPLVVILGPEEQKTNLYTLKNMTTGLQEKVNLEVLMDKIKTAIKSD